MMPVRATAVMLSGYSPDTGYFGAALFRARPGARCKSQVPAGCSYGPINSQVYGSRTSESFR
jgi:hypothetical protein